MGKLLFRGLHFAPQVFIDSFTKLPTYLIPLCGLCVLCIATYKILVFL